MECRIAQRGFPENDTFRAQSAQCAACWHTFYTVAAHIVSHKHTRNKSSENKITHPRRCSPARLPRLQHQNRSPLGNQLSRSKRPSDSAANDNDVCRRREIRSRATAQEDIRRILQPVWHCAVRSWQPRLAISQRGGHHDVCVVLLVVCTCIKCN